MKVLACLLILALVPALVGIEAIVIQWVWNMLVPALLDGPTLDIWQAVAIVVGLMIVGGAFRTTVSTK